MLKISGPNIHIPGVYYLESANANMNPIAIRVGLSEPDYIYWEDTGHGRSVRADKIYLDGVEVTDASAIDQEKMPETIEFINLEGEKFKFVKLTAKIFNDKLKPYVARGTHLNFKTDEEVQRYYQDADFYGAG